MAEPGARRRCGRPLLLLACLFATVLGKPGAGPVGRAPYAGKAPRGVRAAARELLTGTGAEGTGTASEGVREPLGCGGAEAKRGRARGGP